MIYHSVSSNSILAVYSIPRYEQSVEHATEVDDGAIPLMHGVLKDTVSSPMSATN